MAPMDTIAFLLSQMEEDLVLENCPELNKRETDFFEVRTEKSQLGNYFHAFGVKDILRETLSMLHKNFQCFVWISSVLLLPLSGIVLCQVFISAPIVNEVARHIESTAEFLSFPVNTLCKIVYLKMVDNLLSGALCFPFVITLSLLAKAAVTLKIAGHYSGQPVSFPKTFFASYKRIVFTYVWTSAIFLGIGFAFVLLLVASTGLLHIFRFNSDGLAYVLCIAIGLVFSVLFAHLVIISNLAHIVSIIENSRGMAAIEQAFVLMRGRVEAGLVILSFIVTGTSLVEALFQYEILGRPGLSSEFSNGSLSLVWEAPALIIVHCFVKLLDFVLITIYYFSCKAFQDRCDGSYFHVNNLLV